jgi:hypothetical protein
MRPTARPLGEVVNLRRRLGIATILATALPSVALASDFGALLSFLVFWLAIGAVVVSALLCSLFYLSYRDRRIWCFGFPPVAVAAFVVLAALVWFLGNV